MGKYCFALLAMALLTSCKEDPVVLNSYTLQLTPVDGSMALSPGDEIPGIDGRHFLMNTLRFYLSNVSLVDDNGKYYKMKDVFLFKWGSNEQLQGQIPPGTYDSLVFGLGLTPEQNLSNPSAFDDSHPLSIAQDMYWPMLNYRFVLMEGAVDTTIAMTGTVNFPTTYHLGSNELYRRIAIPVNFRLEEGEDTLQVIPLDLKSIFNGPGGVVDMRTHFSNHSTDMPKANIMIDNLAAALQ